VDAPVASFFDTLSSLAPDVAGIGRALADLARDTDYFAPMIAQLDPEENGGFPLHVPDRGPRLFFLHRPRGVMSAVHSHGTWIAVACVAGTETHQRFAVAASGAASVDSEVLLGPGEVVTLMPPADVHSHGHTIGHGEPPYSLILTGDDQLQFARREYDVAAGTSRELPPGDFGTLNLPTQGG
jgi:predicted metal-dependent enzyme (double-stranded beta helix superfamily)